VSAVVPFLRERKIRHVFAFEMISELPKEVVVLEGLCNKIRCGCAWIKLVAKEGGNMTQMNVCIEM